MKRGRLGLSSVYGFIVIFTLLMAGIGASLSIMDSQAAVSNARDRAGQIASSRQGERLSLSLNGTNLTAENIGLIPTTILYLYQKDLTTSSDRRIGGYLQEGANLTLPVTRGMSDFALITSLGNVFWVRNSSGPLALTQSANVPVTFDATGLDASYGSSPILSVDGTSYDYSAMPLTLEWLPGSTHSYSYVQAFASSSGTRVGWSYARGLSSAIQGSLTATRTGSIVSTYGEQFLLTVAGGDSIQFAGSPSGDGWYDAGGTGQFSSSYAWSASGGVRSSLISYSVDGSSSISIARAGSGTYKSVGVSMTSPHTVSLGSVTQYQLGVSGGNGAVVSGSQTGDAWFDSGSAASVSTSYSWGVVQGQSRSNLVSWALDGTSDHSVARAGSGTYATPGIVMDSPHTVSFKSVTQYYVTEQGSPEASGTVGPLTVSYSYNTAPTTLSSWLQNPGFESGSLSPWHYATDDVGATVGTSSTVSRSGSYSGYVYLRSNDCWSISGCSGEMEQDYTLPSDSIVTAISFSAWYYSTSPSWAWASLYDSCGGYSPTGSSGTWAQLSYSWTGSCHPASATMHVFLGAAEGSQSAAYYVYFDDVVSSVTYVTPVSGSVVGGQGSFSASGTTVSYTYAVGYAFPGGSSSDLWSASWPSTEAYSSNSCGGSVGGNTISGSGSSCTLTTSFTGSFGLSMGASPTSDSWYDSGSTLSISSSPSGPFSFTSWSSSAQGLQLGAQSSATTTLTVSSYGTVTASFGVGQ